MGIESKVRKIAKLLADEGGSAKGNGDCWAFIHHVLNKARAKSFWEYNGKTKEPVVASPWGKRVNKPESGDMVIIVGLRYVLQQSRVHRAALWDKPQWSGKYFPRFPKGIAAIATFCAASNDFFFNT